MEYTTTTIHKVNYNNFDKAICEFLKQKGAKDCEFEIVAHHELGNDTDKAFLVGKYDWHKLVESDKEDILNGELHWKGETILNWMYEDGLIPAGEYLVEISW